jgi:hypothetical protein
LEGDMGRGGETWKWPLCAAVAAALLALALLIPRSWIRSFFSPLDRSHWIATPPSRPLLRLLSVPVLIPELEESSEPEQSTRETETMPETLSPAWWDAAWDVRLATETARLLTLAPADTAPGDLLALLGATRLEDLLAQPDSSLANRLTLLRLRNLEAFEQARGFLKAHTFGRRWHNILRQADRIHGEDQLQEPEVPAADR